MARVHPIIWAMAAVLLGIQALLWAGDQGILAPVRGVVYAHLAVGAVPAWAATQSGLAAGWFLAGIFGHALLHASWMHVIFNVVGLVCLGHVVQAQTSTREFLLIAALSAIGGAVGFLLLSAGHSIMVGASGVVFGLFGVVLRWRAERVSAWKMLLLLALVGFPAALISDGPVAWQGHLGGFSVGWVLGGFMPPRRLIAHPFQ
jgi:membrane associated rhomboid family serine protease